MWLLPAVRGPKAMGLEYDYDVCDLPVHYVDIIVAFPFPLEYFTQMLETPDAGCASDS